MSMWGMNDGATLTGKHTWTNDDAKVIFAMKKGLELMISGESSRGTITNDTYTLKGFTSAFDQLTKDC